jgi:sugar lactone lactonase YvrE
MIMKAEVAVEIKSLLGECPIWSHRDQCLYWLDMYKLAIYRYRPKEKRNEQLALPNINHVSSFIPRKKKGFILGVSTGLVFYDELSGSITPFIDPRNNRRDTLLNDAKADYLGRLWVGTYHESEKEPRAALYRIEPNGEFTTVIDQLICSNGPAFSPDGHILYIADSMRSTIYEYDVDPNSGSLGDQKVFASVPRALGFPDGMTVDCDGGLWNAHYGGGLITRYYPNGTIDFTVSLPAPYVTSCMFGGPNLSTLFVTTASSDANGSELTPQAPLSGALFKIDTHFEGIVEPEFLG